MQRKQKVVKTSRESSTRKVELDKIAHARLEALRKETYGRIPRG